MECKKCGEVVPCEECWPEVRLEQMRHNMRHVDRDGLLRMLLEAEDERIEEKRKKAFRSLWR